MLLSHGNGADDNPGVCSAYPHDTSVFAVLLQLLLLFLLLGYFIFFFTLTGKGS